MTLSRSNDRPEVSPVMVWVVCVVPQVVWSSYGANNRCYEQQHHTCGECTGGDEEPLFNVYNRSHYPVGEDQSTDRVFHGVS